MMQDYFDGVRGRVQDLEKQLADAKAEITPPFYVVYIASAGGVKILGKFETEEAVAAGMTEDVARQTGIDLDVVKEVKAALKHYFIKVTPPPY